MGQECFDMFGPWSTCGSSIICQEGSLGHSHHLGQGPGGHLDSVRFGASNMTSSQSINIPLNMWTKRKLPFSGLEHAVLMKWEFFFFPSSSNIYCLDMIALPSSKNTKIYGKSTTWRSFSRGKPSISIVFFVSLLEDMFIPESVVSQDGAALCAAKDCDLLIVRFGHLMWVGCNLMVTYFSTWTRGMKSPI